MNLQYRPSQYIVVLWGGLAMVALALFGVFSGQVAWTWLIGTFGAYCAMAILNSAGYHRLFCHGSYQTSKFWDAFLLIAGAMSCYGSSIGYCVMHTWHHSHADTDQDPHKFDSIKDLFRPNYQIGEVPMSAKRVMKRLLDRPLHAWVHRNYWALPATLALILLWISPTALLYCYLAPVGVVVFSAALFNLIAHDDHGPSNKAYKALFVSGEWRHKLHHDQPWRWDLREKWWHIDCGAYFIMLIKR